MISFYKCVLECHQAGQPRQATIDNFQSKMIFNEKVHFRRLNYLAPNQRAIRKKFNSCTMWTKPSIVLDVAIQIVFCQNINFIFFTIQTRFMIRSRTSIANIFFEFHQAIPVGSLFKLRRCYD